MKAYVYVDGRELGSFDYEHPVEDGKTIPIPTASEEWQSDVVVAITDGDGNVWMSKVSKLERGRYVVEAEDGEAKR